MGWKNAGGSTVNTLDFTYNQSGQQLTAGDNNGTITNTFDALGRLDTQQDVHGITRTYTWDDADRVTQITDTKNGQRDYSYDNANRLQWIQFSGTSQSPLRFDLTFNDRNELTETHCDCALNRQPAIVSAFHFTTPGMREMSANQRHSVPTGMCGNILVGTACPQLARIGTV